MTQPVTPSYLHQESHRWLSSLLSNARRLSARAFADWVSAMDQWIMSNNDITAEPRRLKLAWLALQRNVQKRLRETVSRNEGARIRAKRMIYFTAGLQNERMMSSDLFSDLLSMRTVEAAHLDLEAEVLARETNWLTLRSHLASCESIRVHLLGSTRPWLKAARMRGLITKIVCYDPSDSRLRIDVSGPLRIFRKTTVYARALQAMVFQLGQSYDFRLEIHMGRESGGRVYQILPTDPVAWPAMAIKYDSKLEEKFVAQFIREAPDWELIREPSAVPVQGELFFPDFVLRHPLYPGRSWQVEIVGFWHPEYLRHKIRKLQAAGQSIIVIIDESLNIPASELAAFREVIRFRRHISPAAVIAAARGLAAEKIFALAPTENRSLF